MKIFLPLPRSLSVILMTVTLVLLNSTAGFAAPKTWAGGAGVGLNWTTGANWSGGTIPAAGDDITFNTAGVLTFSTMPAGNIGFNSLTISQGTVTFVNGSARVLTIGSAAATDLSIASGAILTLGNNVTITLLDAATTANITGALTLSGTGAFTTVASSTVTYSGAAQNVVATTYGNLTLGGTNTKTLLANTTVNGTLTINAGVTMAMAAFTIGSPSGLVLESGASGSAITGTGLITLGGDVTVNYTGSGSTAATVAPPVALGADRQFNVAASAGLTMNGIISGSTFGINKGGTGTITLAAANTFDGDYILSSGTTVVSNVTGLGPALNPDFTNRVLTLNGGTVDLATNSTVDAYTFWIGDDVTIVSDRATPGAGINHQLAGLTFLSHTITVNKGANVTSGSAALTFQNVILYGGGVLNTATADVFISGVVANFDAQWKLTKTGAGTLTKTTNNWDLPGDFEIDAGTYDGTTVTTSLEGNWINNGGTLAPGTSTITLRNTVPTAQTIGGSQPTTFNNLVIDNTAGVSLAANQTVNGSLTLTNGLLTIPSANTLIIANGNAIVGGTFDATRHIVTQVNTGTGAQGFLQVNNMAATVLYTFPIGDAANYLPVFLTPSIVCGFRVCSFSGITDNGAPNGVGFSGTRKSVCVDAVWTVNLVAGAPTVTMTTNWPASLEGAAFAAYTNAQIGIAHWDGPNWGVCSGSGNNGTNFATRTGVTVFSPFGVGKALFVLPITLNYFNASKGNSVNNLNWQANCSSSDISFEVERSSDGRNFTTINTVTASAASCNQPFNYSDNSAPAGTVYYRLKATDITGKVYYSSIIKLSSQQKDIELVGLSPNPVSNVAQLKINTSKVDMVNLTIISTEGQVVYRNSVQLQPGSSVVNLNIAKLPAGMYMIKGMFSDGETNTVKFFKQ